MAIIDDSEAGAAPVGVALESDDDDWSVTATMAAATMKYLENIFKILGSWNVYVEGVVIRERWGTEGNLVVRF